MVSSPLFSPASDRRFWSALRSRIDTLLEHRQAKVSAGQDQLNLGPSSATRVVSESSSRELLFSADTHLAFSYGMFLGLECRRI